MVLRAHDVTIVLWETRRGRVSHKIICPNLCNVNIE